MSTNLTASGPAKRQSDNSNISREIDIGGIIINPMDLPSPSSKSLKLST